MSIIVVWSMLQWKTLEESKSKRDEELKSRDLEKSKADQAFLQAPLCTLGDAIASFLEVPDSCTSSLGIVSRHDVEGLQNWDSRGVIKWRPTSIKWYSASSNRRWIFAMTM
jgi:hypothetical protein